MHLSVDSEDLDKLELNKIIPKKENEIVKNFLRSKANKLNMTVQKDDFFKTTVNLVNFFEETYRVPHFKNKLCFKNNKIDENLQKEKYDQVYNLK